MDSPEVVLTVTDIKLPKTNLEYFWNRKKSIPSRNFRPIKSPNDRHSYLTVYCVTVNILKFSLYQFNSHFHQIKRF